MHDVLIFDTIRALSIDYHLQYTMSLVITGKKGPLPVSISTKTSSGKSSSIKKFHEHPDVRSKGVKKPIVVKVVSPLLDDFKAKFFSVANSV